MLSIQLKRIQKPLSDSDIQRLVRWRRKNSFAYVNQPHVTVKSMRWWVDTHMKELYWVIANGVKIGHMGFATYTKDSVEVDNVSRGIDRYRGAMSLALQMLLLNAKRPNIYLRVIPTNKHAIDFYKKHKFIEVGVVGKFLRMKYEYSNTR